jgi:DNA-binding HxlR family transcriptional regulator
MSQKESERGESNQWPIFQEAALPGLLGEFIRLACRNSEADPAAVAATFLVRFATECGTNPHVMVGDSRHSARINAVVVGATGKSRKGLSAGPVKSLFDGRGGCLTTPGPLSSGEGFIFAVRDEQSERKVDKVTGQEDLIVTDPGVQDKRLFVLDEEFAAALTATKRTGNTLSCITRCLYDDGHVEPLTKNNRIKVTGAHVGIVTHITFAELKKCLSETEQLNGYGNRFLWICARRQGVVPFPDPMDEVEKEALWREIQARIEQAQMGGRYAFSEEAKILWAREYPRLSMAHSGLAGSLVNRGEANVLRLSLIYALLAGHTRIEMEDLQAAIAFWEYCHASAFYIFGGAPGDKKKLKVLEMLKANGGRMTKNEIREDCFAKHISSEALTNLLDEMASDHLVDLCAESTGGAPRTVICLKNLVESAISVTNATEYRLSTHNTLNTPNKMSDQGPTFRFMDSQRLEKDEHKMAFFDLDEEIPR